MVLTRPEACRGCPADIVASGFVPPSGPQDARLAIVGQGPGADEAATGEPFIGMSGRHLNKWLVKAGVPRERCAVSNVVWCHLPKNRPPTATEMRHCWEAHVGPHLRSLPELRVIAAVGIPAAQQFIPGAKLKTAGTVAPFALDEREVRVVPLVHPAAIIRGSWAHDPAQPLFLRRAWEIARAEQPPPLLDVSVPPPGGQIAKTVHEVARFLGEILIDKAAVACDIEGTGGILIGIGFARLDTLEAMYVPFRNKAAPFWSSEEDTRCAAEWVDRVLASEQIAKVFHNGSSFDLPFLEEIGFVVNNYADDTMVRAWATYHESVKDLQSLGILYAGLPAWKHLSNVGDEGDEK
jgi:DNA polymerase